MSEKKELIVLDNKTVMQAFSEDGGLDPIVKELKARAEEEAKLHDPSTKKGRAGLISVSAETRKGKTSLDNVRKELCADWVAKKKAVDKNWKVVKGQIDEIAADIRKPVTEFEEKEKAQQEKIKVSMQYLEELPRREVDGVILSAEQLGQKLTEAKSFEIVKEEFGDFADTAQAMLDNAITNLTGFYNAKLAEEERDAEFKQLKAKQEKEEKESLLLSDTLNSIDNHSKTENQEGVPYHCEGIKSNICFNENIIDCLNDLGFSDQSISIVKMKAETVIEKLKIALEDAEKELEKEKNEKAENDRKNSILEKIESFKSTTEQTIEMCTDSAILADKLENISKFEIKEDVYQEFTDKAKVVALECRNNIQKAYDLAVKNEAKKKEDLEKAERERIEKERKAKEAADYEKEKERQADEKYRQRIKNESIAAFEKCGIDTETAMKVFDIIAGENIINISVNF